MLEEANRQHHDGSFWSGDVVDLPDTHGSFDAVFLNAMFGMFGTNRKHFEA